MIFSPPAERLFKIIQLTLPRRARRKRFSRHGSEESGSLPSRWYCRGDQDDGLSLPSFLQKLHHHPALFVTQRPRRLVGQDNRGLPARPGDRNPLLLAARSCEGSGASYRRAPSAPRAASAPKSVPFPQPAVKKGELQVFRMLSLGIRVVLSGIWNPASGSVDGRELIALRSRRVPFSPVSPAVGRQATDDVHAGGFPGADFPQGPQTRPAI
jgi:hypothetical protein